MDRFCLFSHISRNLLKAVLHSFIQFILQFMSADKARRFSSTTSHQASSPLMNLHQSLSKIRTYVFYVRQQETRTPSASLM